MKKKIIILLALCSLLFTSLQASAHGSSYIEDDCGQEKYTCFVQLLDQGNFVKGIIKLLKVQGYVSSDVKVAQFTKDVERAVIRFQQDHGLPPTGTMDDDTLTLLIWGMLPEKLDAVMPIVPGKPETYPDMVYIPTDGGKKRHAKSTCSDMYDPRKVSIRNAAAMGFDACTICEGSRENRLHPEEGR